MERITLKVKDPGHKSILKKPAKTPNKDEQEDHKPESMEDQQLADSSADEHEE